MAGNETIKIVTLNNKCRKGTYIYTRRGKRSHYYKVREGIPNNKVVEHYLKQLPKIRKNKTIAGIKHIQDKTKKTKTTKKKPIEQAIKKGIITKATDITRTTRQKTNEFSKNIMKQAVKNKKHLKLINTEHNLKKIAHRFEHTIIITGEGGETLATLTKTGITPTQAVSETKGILKQNTEIDPSKGLREMAEIGWKGTLYNTGTIKRINITTTFRKQK